MKEPLTNDQIFIGKLTEIVLENLKNENFGVRELAHEAGVSPYSLNRRLYKVLKKKASRLIREVKLMKALEMLQDGHLSASEIAYKTGFNSPAYFNKCFREFFGYPPGKVIKGEINYPGHDNLAMQIQAIDDDHHKWGKRVHIIPVILVLGILLGVSVFIKYSWMKKTDIIHNLISSDGSISIVVMPFQNMTNDTTWEVWQNGIQQDLINSLSNIRELKIRQKTTINRVLRDEGMAEFASISPEIANSISRKLGADTYIYGSIQQTGDRLRLTAQLIATRTNEIITSFETN
jgi:AraC-like DNA-binding protein/TolB-like protein